MEEKITTIQAVTVDVVAEGSTETLIQPNQNEVVLKVSDLESKPICRICYSGASRERLLKPCKCKGTIEYVHRHCLERWLEAKNFQSCELCKHPFETRRTRKGCLEWLREPDVQTERRNFIGDCTCFILLTPLGIATFWLCAEGALYYQKVKSSTMETIALVTLAVFLVIAYFTWVILCTRYHYVLWARWRNHNWNIRIVERVQAEGSSNTSDSIIPMTASFPNDSMEDILVLRDQPTRSFSWMSVMSVVTDSTMIADSNLRPPNESTRKIDTECNTFL